MKFLSDIVADIKPGKEEIAAATKTTEFYVNALNKSMKDARAVLGGSGAKGTWIKGTFDIDIFVKFNYAKYAGRSSEISQILGKTLKKKFPFSRFHGSRDYFQVKKGNFTIEIVPILNIKKSSQAKNITDVSPLHSSWVIRKGKRLRDEILLTKAFLKAHGIYGAESHIKGLSGYACEILTIHHGGFLKLLRASSKWKSRAVIDTEKFYGRKNPLILMNSSKTEGPLVIVDPVQKERNVTAALSEENYQLFIKAAKAFLRKPSKEFFFVKNVTSDELKKSMKKDEKILFFEVLSKAGKPDVAGSMILKAFEFIRRELEKNSFKVLRSGQQFDGSAKLWLVFKKKALQKDRIVDGPPLKMKEHIARFKKQHKKTFKKAGKICAKMPNKYLSPDRLAKKLIRDKYVADRVKKIDLKVL